jgi:hypothetical protein
MRLPSALSILLLTFALSPLAFSTNAPAAEGAPEGAPEGEGVRDYRWFLRQVADLDRLPYLEEGVVSRQFSSYHRGSRYDRATGECVGMDINGDAGFYLTVHSGPKAAGELEELEIPADTPRFPFGDLEWVLEPLERNHVFFLPRSGGADPRTAAPRTKVPEGIVAAIPGPGCIWRIWSANPMGKVRFYLDGETEPLELDFRGLFSGGAKNPDEATLERRAENPFLRPFTFRRAGDGDTLASDSYLPIPFAKSCIVVLDRASFYHFGYKTYPAGTKVATFRLPLSEREVEVWDEVARQLLERGKDPKPERLGTRRAEGSALIEPGAEVVLADIAGPRVIQSLHAKLQGRERYAGSKVLLLGSFDGEERPSVWSPVVNFFGTGFEPRDYRSVPLGYVGGEGYCFFPMPFGKSARLVVRNEGEKPATFSWRIAHAPLDAFPQNAMHFKCKYRREEVCGTFDYPFLECTGAGRFVGAALSIDDAWRSWWGEGDEKIWVDGDVFPSFFGTGSEDYFGDAWGIRKLNETFFACSFDEQNDLHSWTSCYRWQIPDDVPFRERFRATIENYPETIWGTPAVDWDEDYVSTAYWYQVPGGTDFFAPLPAKARRPWGKVPAPPVVEAEEALSAEFARGAMVVDDEDLDRELSRGRAVDLGRIEAGRSVAFEGPRVLMEGPYMIHLHLRRGLEGAAPFEVLVGETLAGASPSDLAARDVAVSGIAVFPRGRSLMKLRFTAAGRAVIDAIQLVPARQVPDALEAERARVVEAGGRSVTAPVTTQVTTQVGVHYSGGRELRYDASGPGDALELEIDLPPGSWNLSAGVTRGPEYGSYDVLLNGKPAGAIEGYAPRLSVRDGARLGVLRGEGGKTRLRFVCRGKAAEAAGHRLGLDYFRRTPIVVEGAIEGETAEVTDVRDGVFVPQNLDARFSGESHLWFHPQKVGASFVWPLEAKEAGRYDLAVYLTKSWDYAIVRVSLDGKALGELDTYAPGVEWGGKTSLGRHDLEAGTHRLEFKVVGQNDKSTGILMGVDCVTFERAPE